MEYADDCQYGCGVLIQHHDMELSEQKLISQSNIRQ